MVVVVLDLVVGVVLDTMRQVETHLIQRHYDGFLRKGKVRNRFDRAQGAGDGGQRALLWMYVAVALLLVAGMAVFVSSRLK